MIRNYSRGEMRILECLQENNATTDQLLEEKGMTPTDLAKYGLNKTLVLKHLPKLKTRHLVIGKLIQKKGRPGNYYAITPFGAVQLFKYKLENNTDDNHSELEKIRNYYKLITKYWDTDLVDLDEHRHQSLLNAIENFDIKSRAKNYISFSITFPSERYFISFEKNYFLVTTPENEDDEKDKIIRELTEQTPVKQYTINEIETDLKKLITFQFYNYLTYIPKNTLKLIEKLKDGIKKGKLSRKDYQKILIQKAQEYRKSLGYDFNLNDPIRLEAEIIKRAEQMLTMIASIIEKDKQLKRLIYELKTEMNPYVKISKLSDSNDN